MTKLIPLTQDKFAIVDAEDYDHLMQWKWALATKGYAQRCYHDKAAKRSRTLFMHRYIMNASEGEVCDHIDGNKLNNSKNNLRLCTRSQNGFNSRPNKGLSHKGIYWCKKSEKWRAQIIFQGASICLGAHQNKIEALRAYDEAALKYGGEFALTNKMLGVL